MQWIDVVGDAGVVVGVVTMMMDVIDVDVVVVVLVVAVDVVVE